MSKLLFYIYNKFLNYNTLQKTSYCSKVIKDSNVIKKKDTTKTKKQISEKAKNAILKSILTRDVKRISDHEIIAPSGIEITVLMKDQKESILSANKDKSTDLKALPRALLPIDKKLGKKHKSTSSADQLTGGGTFRPVRAKPSTVYLGFIPKEWVLFFMPKTGASGLYTFFFTFGTFLISKEYYVMEHNFYNGLSMALLMSLATIHLGPRVAEWLDNDITEYEKEWNEGRETHKSNLQNQIDFEKWAQWSVDGQLLVINAKRENVHLQREEAYRIRQMYVYNKIIERLQYHTAVQDVHKKMVQKNLIEWELEQVHKSLTKELKGEYLKLVLADIKKLTSKK